MNRGSHDAAELRAIGVTRREREVLAALAEHLTNSEIADRLHISERTVETHVSSLLRKLGGSNRRALVGIAARIGRGAPGAPRGLPPLFGTLLGTGPLIGRSREDAELVDLWGRAKAGAGRLAVVSGEAGVGKSRLVAELARRAHEDGAEVLVGSSRDGAGRPYEPVAGIVWDALDGLDPGAIESRLGDAGPVLARLAPEVAGRHGYRAGPMVSDLDVERVRLFDAVARYLAAMSEQTPLLVVVEDINWATRDTGDLVRHLVHRVAGLPVLIVVTARDPAPDLESFLAGVARAPNGHRTDLVGLDFEAVVDLVRSLDGGRGQPLPDSFLVRLHQTTGGNPFFVRELVDTMLRSDEGPPSDPARLDLPPNIRDVVADRLATVSGAARRLLDAAGVLGAEPELSGLVATTGVSVDDALRALEEAELAGFVVPVPERPGRFTFRHALLRSAVYELMPAARRLRLHRQAAAASAASDVGDRAGEIARHVTRAAVAGDAAVELPALAGDAARRSLDFDNAASHFEQAVQAARRSAGTDPALLCDLTIKWGEALNHRRDPRYRAVLLESARLARGLKDAERLAEAALALTPRGWVTNAGAPDRDALNLAREAVYGLPQEASALRARVLALLAAEVAFTPEHDQQRAFTREALDVARELDDPATLGRVLIGHHWSGVDPADLHERLRVAEELVELGDRLDDPLFTLQGLVFRYGDLLESGEPATADAALEQAVALVERLQVPFFEWLTLAMRAGRAMLAGRLAEGEQLANQTLTVDVPAEVPTLFAYGALLITLRVDQGVEPDLVDQVDSLVAAQPEFPVLRAGLTHLLLATGRPADARRHLDWFAGTRFTALPRNVQWLVGTAMLADAAAVLEDAAAAGVLYEQLLPFRGRNTWYGLGCVWPVDLALGQLASVLGDHRAAEQHLGSAAALARVMEAPVHLARVLVHQAWAGLRSDRPDRAAAGAVLGEGVELARRHDAAGVLGQVERLGLDSFVRSGPG